MQAAFSSLEPALVPPEVELLLSGHVHVEEALDFQGGVRPAQLVTGFSGTEEDTVPLPPKLADADAPAPGAPVQDFSSWVDGFGFAVLDRMSQDRWRVSIRDSSGREVNACELTGRTLRCNIAQVSAP